MRSRPRPSWDGPQSLHRVPVINARIPFTAPAEGTPGEWVTVSPLPSGASGIAGPIGPGFRVPALVISPWSRGGWVCSEPFDHTSTLRFLEPRFGVMEPNISAWRRKTLGDMTSALRLHGHDHSFPRLPDPTALYELEKQEAATLPPERGSERATASLTDCRRTCGGPSRRSSSRRSRGGRHAAW
ncbi:alkaline phosphatase family protein [Actinoallomurus vinaceus]